MKHEMTITVTFDTDEQEGVVLLKNPTAPFGKLILANVKVSNGIKVTRSGGGTLAPHVRALVCACYHYLTDDD